MNVLVSAQDPGGANSVIPVAVELINRGHEVVARVEDVAYDMFAMRGIPLGVCSDPTAVLLGTSAGKSIEKQVTVEMRGKAPTLAVLDFWSNYWQRFSSPGIKDFAYLPDLVCVMDNIAKEEMVADGFPPERLVVTGNPHFDHFADGITTEREDQKRILFISQPIRMDGALLGFAPPSIDEYAVLEAAYAALPDGHRLSIRLHPRDIANKYNSYLDSRVSIAQETTLEEAISKSGLIIGAASLSLMQAAAAGKKVLSYEPILNGPDEMVSNRIGVTIRIKSLHELTKAFKKYAERKWSYRTRPLREVWPAGATERVVKTIIALVNK